MPAPRQKLSGMTFFNTGVKLDIFVSEMNAGAGHEYLPGGSGQAGSGCRIGQSAFPVDLACRAPISCQEASLYMRSVFGYYLFAACIAYFILSTLTITIYCRLHVRTMSNAQPYYGSLVLEKNARMMYIFCISTEYGLAFIQSRSNNKARNNMCHTDVQ